MTPSKNIFYSETEVCCHRILFWYDLITLKQTDELKERLTEEAESRAKACIVDGCRSGELNCLWEGETEVRGWWEIVKEQP